MAAALALGIVGVWLLGQTMAGRLPARLLSYRGGNLALIGAGSAGEGGMAGGALATVPSSSTGAPGLHWPIHGTVSQEYGHNGHPGIDIFSACGAPVGAAGNGRVTTAGANDGGYGNLVIIDHGGGITTYYAHLAEVTCHVGDVLETGQQVGLEGSTGHSTGCHLHFEVRKGGATVDPRSMVGGNP